MSINFVLWFFLYNYSKNARLKKDSLFCAGGVAMNIANISPVLFVRHEKLLEVALFKATRICILLICVGIFANQFAKIANGGKMPVIAIPDPEYIVVFDDHHGSVQNPLAGFFGDWIETEIAPADSALMLAASSVLSFPIGESIVASPGDVLMWIFTGGSMVLASTLILLIAIRATCISYLKT